MTNTQHRTPAAIRWLRRQLADFAADCVTAHRKLAELQMSPDRQMIKPGTVPDSYAEFLFRTSGALRHEPPARSRASR